MIDPELQVLAESLSTRCNLANRPRFSVHLDEMTEREATLFSSDIKINGCLCRKENCKGDWFTFEKKPSPQTGEKDWTCSRECIPVQVLMEFAALGNSDSDQSEDFVKRFKKIRPEVIPSILNTMGRVRNMDTIAGTFFGLSVAARTLMESMSVASQPDDDSDSDK